MILSTDCRGSGTVFRGSDRPGEFLVTWSCRARSFQETLPLHYVDMGKTTHTLCGIDTTASVYAWECDGRYEDQTLPNCKRCIKARERMK